MTEPGPLPLRHNALPAAGLALAVFAGVCFPLTNTDIWWHLAAGRWMVEHGAPVMVDPLAADVAGVRWIDVHWLFQLLVYATHRVGGVLALVLLKCALTATAALLLLRALVHAAATDRREAAPPAALTTGELLIAAAIIALPVYLARYLVLARPIAITLLCLSAFLLVLERYRRTGQRRLLLWLLPVQLLWANTQGLFLLGPVVCGCYLAGDAGAHLLGRRGLAGFASPLGPRQLGWLALVLPALVLASLASPHGLDNLALPLRLFDRIDPVGHALFSENVSENLPPWLLERVHAERVGYLKWLAALAFGSLLLTHRRPALPRLLLLGAMFGLALMAYRNVLLFCWVAGPIAAANLLGWLGSRPAHRRPAHRPRLGALPLAAGAAAVLLAALPLHRLAVADDGLAIHRPAPFRVPTEATATLGRLGLRGELFNSVRYGGYVAWALHGKHRPGIDGRLVLRSAARFGEHLRVVDDPRRFFAFAERRGITLAMLPTAFPDRYVALAAALYRHPDWRLLQTDGTQTLFAHRRALPRDTATVRLGSPATVQSIAARLDRTHAGDPQIATRARIHLGRLLAEAGELERATELLSAAGARGDRGDRGDRLGASLLARVHYLAGRRERARALAHRLLERDDEDVDSLVLLAMLDADDRRYRQAIVWARQALAVDPHHLQARRLLTRIEREQPGGRAR